MQKKNKNHLFFDAIFAVIYIYLIKKTEREEMKRKYSIECHKKKNQTKPNK